MRIIVRVESIELDQLLDPSRINYAVELMRPRPYFFSSSKGYIIADQDLEKLGVDPLEIDLCLTQLDQAFSSEWDGRKNSLTFIDGGSAFHIDFGHKLYPRIIFRTRLPWREETSDGEIKISMARECTD